MNSNAHLLKALHRRKKERAQGKERVIHYRDDMMC